MRLGLVTYNLARDWDVPTIIQRCTSAGFEAVELRTTHAHGVEPSLGVVERELVRRQFEASAVRLLSLGTTCEFHSVDSQEVRRNIELTKEFVRLAADVHAVGVKVRPNGLHPAQVMPERETLEQIGLALSECGQFAEGYGVGIWLEVHGPGTSDLQRVRRIMEVCGQESVGVCWNSNPTDVENGSVEGTFSLVKDWVRSVHINELHVRSYPWRQLLALLRDDGYQGYTLAEIPGSPDPECLMRYYRALWLELTCR